MSRDTQTLRDIWNAAQEILEFTAGLDRDRLAGDRRTCAAVLYEIVVIGEAANCLSQQFQTQHPNVPWKDIIGMRNIVTHQYGKVDSDVLWDVVSQDIPELLAWLEPLL